MARRPQALAFGILFASILAGSLAFGHGATQIWAALDPGPYDLPCTTATATANMTPVLVSAHAPSPITPECEGAMDDGAPADATSTDAPASAPHRPTHMRHDRPGYGFTP